MQALTDHQLQNRAIRQRLFAQLCIGLSIGALLWGIICTSLGLHECSFIAYGFIALTALNLMVCRRTGSMDLCMQFQVFISLVLPFVFQSALGGMHSSGMVMFWSFVALAGALTFQRRLTSLAWVVLEIVMVLIWVIADPIFPASVFPAPEIDEPTSRYFLALNIAAVASVIFSLALFFVRVQGRSRKRMHEVKQELSVLNVALEERSLEVAQSLTYARHLQSATLPDLDAHPHLFQEQFVWGRSKDAVGGDTHWLGSFGDHSYLILLDCTGHGIPGAMLSMLCHGILNEVVFRDEAQTAAEVIALTQKRLDQQLNRARTGSQDGAEMAVLKFDRATHTVTFAGIGCSLIHTTDTTVSTLRGDRVLRTQQANWQGLSETTLSLEDASRLYLFTDGVTDQFCEQEVRKYSLKRLESALHGLREAPFKDVQNQLQSSFQLWRGGTAQVDDMLIIGVRPQVAWCMAHVGNAQVA
jgi:serine phosphatase RsbU (regulator of sigma subunit)